jgi:hypothetical protein
MKVNLKIICKTEKVPLQIKTGKVQPSSGVKENGWRVKKTWVKFLDSHKKKKGIKEIIMKKGLSSKIVTSKVKIDVFEMILTFCLNNTNYLKMAFPTKFGLNVMQDNI